MKIVATVTNIADVVHGGGVPENRSAIIELRDDQIPELIREYLDLEEWASQGKNRFTYRSLQFSILEE